MYSRGIYPPPPPPPHTHTHPHTPSRGTPLTKRPTDISAYNTKNWEHNSGGCTQQEYSPPPPPGTQLTKRPTRLLWTFISDVISLPRESRNFVANFEAKRTSSLQPAHFQPLPSPLTVSSQLQELDSLPRLHDDATAWTTPAETMAWTKAVSRNPARRTLTISVKPWPNGPPNSSQLDPSSQLRWSLVSFGHPPGSSWIELAWIWSSSNFRSTRARFPPFGHLSQLQSTLANLFCY